MMRIAIIVSGIVIFSNLCIGATINVPADQPTIQAGIDAASDGDTVLVADGTYTGEGNHDIDFGGRNIVVKSQNGPEYTIIDCEDSGRGFYFQSGEDSTAILKGLTIRNGVAERGAGIRIDISTPTIINCSFESCSADIGAAIYFSGTNERITEIVRCRFLNNASGTIYCNADRDLRFAHCLFQGNYGWAVLTLGDLGGEATFIIDNCSFINNSNPSGPCVYYSANPSYVIFTNCLLYGNVGISNRPPIYDRPDSISCTDIYGNIPGDWIWPIEDQLLINNNFSADPLFCDVASGDFNISASSPCHPDSSCGLVGSNDVGCLGDIITNFGIEGETSILNVVDHSPVFVWNSMEGSTQEAFEIAVGTDYDWMEAEMWNPDVFNATDTFIAYSGVPLADDGEIFYLRIRISDGSDWSLWYETSFRMNSVPTVPFNLFPMDSSIVYNLAPTLSIANSSDAEGDDLFYDFMIEVDCVLVGEANIPQQIDSTEWTSEPLPYDNFPYLWTARAFDGYEYSDWSASFRFWTNAVEEWPYPFDLTYPPDTGGMQVYDFPTQFSWGPSYDPDPFDSAYYKLHISIDDAFLFEAIIDSVYALTYPVGGLQFGTHYWWKVEAIDTRGNSTVSNSVADFLTWVLGDANADGLSNVGDAVFLINYVFKGGDAPYPIKAGDANGDCLTNVGDAVYMINFVFKGGSDPVVGCGASAF